jgi:hypothetical protein
MAASIIGKAPISLMIFQVEIGAVFMLSAADFGTVSAKLFPANAR